MVASVLVALAALAAPATGVPFETFRLPSGNIGCLYVRPGGPLRCDIRSGLRPEPRRACELDWTGITLPSTRRAAPQCAGDTAYDPHGRVLRYGAVWRYGAITCRSARDGLRCSNRRRHGFFLARARWRVY